MTKSDMSSPHDELREARLARGLTQKELAAELGIAQTTLSAYECGARSIPDGLIYKIKEMIPEELGTAATGDELRALRISRGLIIKDLASALNIPQSTLVSYETGRTSVPRGLFERIQNLFPELPGQDTESVPSMQTKKVQESFTELPDQVAERKPRKQFKRVKKLLSELPDLPSEEDIEAESHNLTPGEQLKRLRISRGLSKTDLAKALHLSHVMIHYYETGKKKIPDGLIEKIETMFPCESAQSNPGKELKKLRQSLGLTQEQLGAVLGITHHAVSHYETGRTPVPNGLLSMMKRLKK